MEIKNTRHEGWAIRALNRIAKSASEKVSSDSLIRWAVYNLIIENYGKSNNINKDIIKDREFEARKICERNN